MRLFSILAALCLPLTSPLEAGPMNCEPAELQPMLEAFLEQTGLPGGYLAVFTADGACLTKSGVRSIDTGGELAADTAFHFGSNGKAVTASMIAALVERNRIDWSLTVSEAFGPAARKLDRHFREVTLAEFLRHQSGLGAHSSDDAFMHAMSFRGTPREARHLYAVNVLSRPPEQSRGETRYSNAGYAVAAAMVESAVGQDFESLVRQLVFEPLGIRGGFGALGPDVPNAALGHAWQDGRYVRRDDTSVPVFHPAGDLWMDVAGYLQFARVHLAGLAGRNSPGFLEAASIQFLHEPVRGYALGWGVQEFQDGELHLHLGGAGLSLAFIALRPNTRQGYLIAVNGGGGETEPAVIELFRTLDSAWRECRLDTHELPL